MLSDLLDLAENFLRSKRQADALVQLDEVVGKSLAQ
jgi:hypothetical protein